MCNAAAASLDPADVSFSALYPPACDARNATLPVATKLQAADGCSADACAVTVTLERGIDWALALRGSAGVNALTAELVNGSGKSEVVTVATFQDVASAAMISSSASVSVCATQVPVSASRLSLVEECNIAQLCQGAAGDTGCSTALQQDLNVADVACQAETCTGNLTLATALPCDGSSGDATALIVAVQVASSTISNYLSVGSMVATNFSISAADGVDVGSSEIVLTTDTFCEATAVNLSLEYGSSSGSDAALIDVSNLNTTSKGTIVVELATPLKQSLEGEGVTFSLSQCGITASAFTATVGAGSSSSDEGDSTSEESDESDNDTTTAVAGSEATAQESDANTGLSGGLYVGIGIGVVAFLGFLGECYIHKRRQAQQPVATNPNPATATIGYANTM